MSDHFGYLLNRLEGAAGSRNPAEAGYGPKRQAVLDYVNGLEGRIVVLTAAAADKASTFGPAELLAIVAAVLRPHVSVESRDGDRTATEWGMDMVSLAREYVGQREAGAG